MPISLPLPLPRHFTLQCSKRRFTTVSRGLSPPSLSTPSSRSSTEIRATTRDNPSPVPSLMCSFHRLFASRQAYAFLLCHTLYQNHDQPLNSQISERWKVFVSLRAKTDQQQPALFSRLSVATRRLLFLRGTPAPRRQARPSALRRRP